MYVHIMNSHHHEKKKPGHSSFVCRLCRKIHSLKTCRLFLQMNTNQRMDVVKKYGYCLNCLAHTHSQGSCFTKTGCRYCHQRHHSLLHMHPRLKKKTFSRSTKSQARSKPNKKSETASASKNIPTPLRPNEAAKESSTSLTAILRQNAATLLPTASVIINAKDGKHYARCLLDSASRMSSISKPFVDKLQLTTLELDNETICPITLWSRIEENFKIETTLRVHRRISTMTPKESYPVSIKSHFHNLVLADKTFYKSSAIDIVLGVDILSRIMREGLFARVGLPTAQNTAFGMVIYGTFSI
ncbi:uncharacterized protein LOC131998516 isoform X1 [Stomoxys calcitrans]|uniref:uncharacterized protein LOC131994094 isoform X1 n=2 Tax=Stomoxys calcitrans TaxID=35570 RepID=UPI0027E39C9F|nr:uncharacterized protein LOC131994094 isoform X1 [Stomoxys calcitrans]XP_059225607.1 uncharacterized protein LOC131997840 isoform X1 [Stomoxys calcitrans]XP_059226830.1 uncharacterized protein LOC131998516 isoform X1 [Stomoxys calcitrans]